MIVVRGIGIDKNFGAEPVLSQCSISLQKGEIYGLVGINGAGKTTLMKILLGLQRPDEGIVELFGKEPDEDRGYLLKIGSMIERPVFYEHLNAIEILEMHLRYMGKEASVSGMLDRVGLYHARKKPVSSYSLGMKQRLGIADVLMKDPQIIIMDEPTLGIDPEGMRELLALIRQLSEEDQRTILISSHQLHQVQQICDRVGIFVKGKLIACGSVGELAVQLQSEGNYILELEAYPHDDRLENLLHTVEGVKKIAKENEMILVHSDRDCHNDVIVTLLMNGYDLRRLRQRGGDLDEIYSKYFEKAGETYDSDTGKRKGFRDNFRSLVRHASGKGK